MIIFLQNKSFFLVPRKDQCPVRQLKVKKKPRQTKGKARRACQAMRKPMPNKAKANERKQKPKTTRESQTKKWPTLYKPRQK